LAYSGLSLIALSHKHPDVVDRKTSTIFLSYKDENHLALRRLLKKFGNEAKELGIDLRVTDSPDK